MMKYDLTVAEEANGMRMDAYIASQLQGVLSRTKIKSIIKSGAVFLDQTVVDNPHYVVSPGEKISFSVKEPEPEFVKAENIPLSIIHEDESVLIVDKPAGLVVHPGAGQRSHTLVNALTYYSQNLSTVGGWDRPGIVHRIDKDTSGILVVAKTNQAHEFLAKQFKAHTIKRHYSVIVKGVVQHDEGQCDASIGSGKMFKKKMVVETSQGRDARTFFKVIERFKDASLLDITLDTGRTHQIRVHMRYLGYPVLGDKLYGVQTPYIKRQALHAYCLGFIHPKTQEYVEFNSPMPDDMCTLLTALQKNK